MMPVSGCSVSPHDFNNECLHVLMDLVLKESLADGVNSPTGITVITHRQKCIHLELLSC